MKRKAKTLGLWFEAIKCQRTATFASQVLAASKMRRLLLNWRCLNEKSMLATEYFGNAFRSRVVPLAFSALNLYC